jgi:hypothetical protein
MASLANRLRNLASSPQGRKVMARAQTELAKPQNQAKLRKAIAKLSGRGAKKY